MLFSRDDHATLAKIPLQPLDQAMRQQASVLLERFEVVTVGIDGGGLDDMLGLAVIGRAKGSLEWLLWNHAWVQEEVLELRKDIAERLRDFEQDGDLTVCKGAPQENKGVADIVKRIHK